MKQIGIRELRQNASVWLKQVRQGESFEITDRGRPIALLTPRPGNELDRLRAAGLISEAKGNFLDWEPLPAEEGVPTLSEILTEMRADERW